MTRDYRRPSDDTARLSALEWTIYGMPGSPGVLTRLDTRQTAIEVRQTGTETRVHAIESLIDRAQWIWKAARWAAVLMAFLALTIAPDDLADRIVKAVGAIKAVGSLGGL